APALLEAWRLRRLLQQLGIGEREVLGQLFALRRKSDGATINLVPAVDERIEHDAEKLVGQLERHLLAAGRSFAREQRERVGEIGAGEAEDGRERGRQRAAVVEEGVERVGDVALADAEGAAERAGSTRCARAAAGLDELAERGGEIQDRIGR